MYCYPCIFDVICLTYLSLHRYLSDVAHVDIYWFIGSRLDEVTTLPRLSKPLTGSSIVPWRYHFNTVTFSYTSAFWSWEDWELQLDWMALRGINLPLAWVGEEKIAVEVFREIGLTDSEIASFLAGPAFQGWNHMGNIQGSWGEELPSAWIDSQFELQKKIVARMVELGMTPVLPAFAGFVPRAFSRVLPNATVVNGSQWEDFPFQYTNVTFLEPFDAEFALLQSSFLAKQREAYGNVTHIYAIDQYNENDPYSGDETYLQNVTRNTLNSLKAADPDAVWITQGWQFYSNSEFWTEARVKAYLSGVESDSDMIILDLFSESQPQWQKFDSYYGKPWIWCQLHDYGQNMGLYGQIMNITVDPVEALANSSSLVGFGLTMEGQEGNEIVYDLLLDQAWSETPIETAEYFHDWVTTRYTGARYVPDAIYQAWEIMRTTVYNNTQLASSAVPKSILELIPSTSGLVNRTGHHPTTLNYDPSVVVDAWRLFYDAARIENSLWLDPSYQHDMVDITRQVLANAFIPLYEKMVSTYMSGNATTASIITAGQKLTTLLSALDSVLSTSKSFRLNSWIQAARSLAGGNDTLADLYEYDARNQITLWGPTGQISDYASKSWAGLVSSYYKSRWELFVSYLASTPASQYNETAFESGLLEFELQWQTQTSTNSKSTGVSGDLAQVLEKTKRDWPDVFNC